MWKSKENELLSKKAKKNLLGRQVITCLVPQMEHFTMKIFYFFLLIISNYANGHLKTAFGSNHQKDIRLKQNNVPSHAIPPSDRQTVVGRTKQIVEIEKCFNFWLSFQLVIIKRVIKGIHIKWKLHICHRKFH